MVIDFVDNTTKHDLVTFASLFNSGIDLQGKCLTEVAKQARAGEIAVPYLSSTDLQKVGQIETLTTPVDLFKGTRRRDSGRVKGMTGMGSFNLPVEPSGSGYVRGWESSPGRWRVSGRIDGVHFDDSTSFTESRAYTYAQGLASRMVCPPRVGGRVDSYDKTKGRGFISRRDGPRVSVHRSAIRRGPLCEGDLVEFEILETSTGPIAHNVTKVVEAPIEP
jgi:cold shock CspA family protein